MNSEFGKRFNIAFRKISFANDAYDPEQKRDNDGKWTKGTPLADFLGEEFVGYKGQDAINKLYQEKRGHILNAFYRSDIGHISLVWGDEEKGLAHLLARRQKQGIDIKSFISDMAEVVEKGQVYKNKYSSTRLDIWRNNKLVVLDTEYDGEKFNWVITEFVQKNEPKR